MQYCLAIGVVSVAKGYGVVVAMLLMTDGGN